MTEPRTEAGLVEALTDAIESQNLYHGRYGTTPAGSATARAILSCLRNHHGIDLEAEAAAGPRDEGLREAAQRLVDVIFAEAQAEPFILPLRGMRAANDLRAALAKAGPRDEGLDVERLARAMQNVEDELTATNIAYEYAALAKASE